MKRSKFLAGFLGLIVISQWIITFFFYKRLPIKLIIPSSPENILIDRPYFFAFAILSTVLAGLTFFLMRHKTSLPFFGKSRLEELPLEFSASVYDRAYQVLVMTMIFIIMVIIYVQVTLALFSSGMSREFDLGALFAVSPIIVLYLAFNFYMLNRMSRSAVEYWEEQKFTPRNTEDKSG